MLLTVFGHLLVEKTALTHRGLFAQEKCSHCRSPQPLGHTEKSAKLSRFEDATLIIGRASLHCFFLRSQETAGSRAIWLHHVPAVGRSHRHHRKSHSAHRAAKGRLKLEHGLRGGWPQGDGFFASNSCRCRKPSEVQKTMFFPADCPFASLP